MRATTLHSWVAYVLLVVVAAGAGVWAAENGRENTVRGCQRARLDRIQNANAWEAAYWARTHAAHLERGADQRNDLRAARAYLIAAHGLRARVVDCQRALPPVWQP